MKWDPARVALEMETMVSNGCFVFDYTEWLTANQIKSFFSRMTVKQRTSQQKSYSQVSIISTTTPQSTRSNIAGNLLSSGDVANIDEEYTDDESDDRELQVYSWRQMLDEARGVLDKCLDTSTKLLTETASFSPPSNTTTSVKRKSTAAVSKASRSKLK